MMNARDIRQRMKSIQSTQKITKAMRMIAASKLAKAQSRASQARPYADTIKRIAAHLDQDPFHYDHPLLVKKKEGKVALVVFTSNQGLCGAYNINVQKLAESFMAERPEADLVLFPLGKKGRAYFKDHPKARELVGVDFKDDFGFSEARLLADTMVKLYVEEGYGEVQLVYNRFLSVMHQEAVMDQLLPIPADADLHAEVDYLFEPESKMVVEKIMPKYMETEVYRASLESRASEQAARVSAMEGATSSANDILRDLGIRLNRVRQEAITKELAEIVGGAEALKKR